MGSGAEGEARRRRAASTASKGSPRTRRVSWSLSATARESCNCMGRLYIPRTEENLAKGCFILDNTTTLEGRSLASESRVALAPGMTDR
jgi:hypothetical protein